jgi:gamma-glutamylcyclotransferase (GGCT)/AIG2-like uncharacterized protein YtfP
MDKIFLAVNGSLMRGLALNENLLTVNAKFVRVDLTSDRYRMWSINDQYPAMQRSSEGGQNIQLEIWQMSSSALVKLLESEPPGLCLGKVELADNQWLFGILGEDFICQGMKEITSWGGWRDYQSNLIE